MHGSDKSELAEILNEGEIKSVDKFCTTFYKSRLCSCGKFGIFALVKCHGTTWLTKSRATGGPEFRNPRETRNISIRPEIFKLQDSFVFQTDPISSRHCSRVLSFSRLISKRLNLLVAYIRSWLKIWQQKLFITWQMSPQVLQVTSLPINRGTGGRGGGVGEVGEGTLEEPPLNVAGSCIDCRRRRHWLSISKFQ